MRPLGIQKVFKSGKLIQPLQLAQRFMHRHPIFKFGGDVTLIIKLNVGVMLRKVITTLFKL